MSGFVYFVQAGPDGPIKIGFTASLPKRRLNELVTASPFALRILGYVQGTINFERRLHARLKVHRTKGEWFAPHSEVLEAVRETLARSPQVSVPDGGYQRLSPLRDYRRRRKISAQKLADMLDVTRVTVSRWEIGMRLIDVEHLPRVVAATGISARVLRPDLAKLFDAGPVVAEAAE